jgi:hypothetical protein
MPPTAASIPTRSTTRLKSLMPKSTRHSIHRAASSTTAISSANAMSPVCQPQSSSAAARRKGGGFMRQTL